MIGTNKMKEYLLSICIPTYNRSKDLKKNLQLLDEQIVSNSLIDKVYIIVSDNASTDETPRVLEDFKNSTDVYIDYYIQDENVGAERNQLIVGEVSKAKYIMLLGDDDYLHEEYLTNVVFQLETHTHLSCIVSNYNGVTPEGKYLFTRDKNGVTSYFKQGFKSCYNNFWKAHQLSGLVFINDGVYDIYKERGLRNLYPQIFLFAYSTLIGDCLYLVDYPVSVTQIPQSKKDWSYGKDGLIPDNFNNCIHLGFNVFKESKLENIILNKSMYGIIGYPTFNQVLLCMYLILISKNTVWPTKTYCVFVFYPYCLYVYFKKRVKNAIKRIIKWDLHR